MGAGFRGLRGVLTGHPDPDGHSNGPSSAESASLSAATPSPARAFRLVGAILNDMAHALHSPDHPEERITTVLRWLGRIVPYDRAAILAHEAPDTRRLFIAPEPTPADNAVLEPAMSRLLGLLSEQGRPRRARSRWTSPA